MSLMPDENEGSAVLQQDPGDTAKVNEEPGDSNKLDSAVIEAGESGVSGNRSDRMLEYLQEAREEEGSDDVAGLPVNGSAFRKFKTVEDGHEIDVLSDTNRAPSSAGSYSTPDDTPSLHVCICAGSFHYA
jgi:hypothetical protein